MKQRTYDDDLASPRKDTGGEGPERVGGVFTLGPWTVETLTGVLTDGSRVRRLEPRAMDVLAFLARRRGCVVSRQDLIEEVWGGIAISDGAVTQMIVAIRRALGDSARNPTYLRTVPKRGYVLNAENSVTDHPPPAVPESLPQQLEGWKPGPRSALLLVATVTVVMVILAAALWKPTTTRPSIAVATFQNLDEIAAEERWAEGLTADLLSAMGSTVLTDISLATAPLPASRPLARETELVLSGSVRRQGSIARISCQVTSARTGKLAQASTCDFDSQDKLAAQQLAARVLAAGMNCLEER